MNEVGLNARWLGKDMTHEETQEFTIKVLNHMRERLGDYQVEFGDLYNLEATPAESTSFRLAKHDRKRWPDIKTAGNEGDTPYYTNSSHLPVEYTADIFEALDIQDELQTLYTSGTVFHAFLGEKLPDWRAAAKLVRTIANNYKLPYYTMSPTYSICRNHGYIQGEHFTCPECGESAEVYSRITGYYRPVQNWNEGKSQEYKNRKLYDMNKARNMSDQMNHIAKEEVLNPNEALVQKIKESMAEDQIYLFTTKTCPNCQVVKEYLGDIDYTIVDAEEEIQLTMEYSVMQAPTLVVVKNGVVNKYVNVSNIKQFAESQVLCLAQ